MKGYNDITTYASNRFSLTLFTGLMFPFGIPGVQAMTAGTGVLHSEINGGPDVCRLYQLWMAPRRAGLAPSYVDVPSPMRGGGLTRLASGVDLPGRDVVHADGEDELTPPP